MVWNILAVFGIICGFLLMIKGLDTLIYWRAWFFGIAGLAMFLPGVITICLRIKHLIGGRPEE